MTTTMEDVHFNQAIDDYYSGLTDIFEKLSDCKTVSDLQVVLDELDRYTSENANPISEISEGVFLEGLSDSLRHLGNTELIQDNNKCNAWKHTKITLLASVVIASLFFWLGGL